MASGIFAVLDDIASLMDDVAVTTKIASQKTAGILGDDLAVNAEKATGFLSSRELPVLWAITKGSLINKIIIVPIALLLSAFLPAAIKVILVLGGCYLAYEGVEKIIEFLFHRKKQGDEVIKENNQNNQDAEKTKVKAAIATDFILSIEIVIIALGSVANETLTVQIVTVAAVALLATIGVYGIVALIVRMDDAGFKLMMLAKNKGIIASVGNLLVKMLPIVIRILSIVGTAALVLVSGGIFVHNIEYLHHLLPDAPTMLRELAAGFVVGIAVVALITAGKKIVTLVKPQVRG